MKAKDYAKRYKDSPTDETLAKIIDDFLNEIIGISKTRNVKCDAATFAVFEEQNKKWKAFAREVGTIREDGFELVVKNEFLFVWTAWQSYRQNINFRKRMYL